MSNTGLSPIIVYWVVPNHSILSPGKYLTNKTYICAGLHIGLLYYVKYFFGKNGEIFQKNWRNFSNFGDVIQSIGEVIQMFVHKRFWMCLWIPWTGPILTEPIYNVSKCIFDSFHDKSFVTGDWGQNWLLICWFQPKNIGDLVISRKSGDGHKIFEIRWFLRVKFQLLANMGFNFIKSCHGVL